MLKVKNSDSFNRFESEAVKIMSAHGGKLISAFVPTHNPEASDNWDEVHVLRFPDKASLESYRSDSRLAALADLRAEAITETQIHVSERHVSYQVE